HKLVAPADQVAILVDVEARDTFAQALRAGGIGWAGLGDKGVAVEARLKPAAPEDGGLDERQSRRSVGQRPVVQRTDAHRCIGVVPSVILTRSHLGKAVYLGAVFHFIEHSIALTEGAAEGIAEPVGEDIVAGGDAV